MPKRIRITLDDVAQWSNLLESAYFASKGKHSRRPVQAFFQQFDKNLSRLGEEIRSGSFEPGPYQRFDIHDPKPRSIHAPAFRDRIVHHAVMRLAGPWIDRLLIDDSFACRIGKGAIAAVQRAQHFSRRNLWYSKVDIRQYFASIDHQLLLARLMRRFSDPGYLEMLRKIVSSFGTDEGRGLPIGALTSQHFANLYLTDADRWLVSQPQVRGLVRYMDDTICWFESKQAAKTTVEELRDFLNHQLRLTLSQKLQINRATHGVTFCGYRIFPGTIKLSRRRQRLYLTARRKWELKYLCGAINELELQARFASAYAISSHAAATSWRRDRLRRGLVDEV